MINIDTISSNAIKVTILGKLEGGDFAAIAPKMAELTALHGTLRLVIDATGFDGWDNANMVAKHFNFVRDHQKKIEQIALVAGQQWQNWIAGLASLFIHPEIKVFDKDGLVQAESWVTHKAA